MKRIFEFAFLGVTISLLYTCAGKKDLLSYSRENISEKNLREHTKFISHDLMEGRSTGSRGIRITQEYIASQFAVNGVNPGGENGSYFQKVPFIKHVLLPTSSYKFIRGTDEYTLKHIDDIIPITMNIENLIQIQSEVVFVGYGIDAPEYEWND